jgi:hypothetical protein
MEKEFSYVQFPLCLIRETYKKDIESSLRLILRFGIMNYATKLKYNLYDVAKQVCYYYYRKQDIIQNSIIKKIQKAIDEDLFTPDEDYNGFAGDTFQPDDNISEILKLFESDPQFKEDSILHYRLHLCTSINHLGISIASNDSLIKSYNTALLIKKNFEEKYGPDAMPFCKKSMLFEFIENPKDIDLFRAYIGIKSLIGQKVYVTTHKTVILLRLMGCKSNESLKAFLKSNKDAKIIYDKYSVRRQIDKLFLRLMEKGFIIVLSKKHESRIYISAKLKTPSELANAILKDREKNNLKKQLAEASNLL